MIGKRNNNFTTYTYFVGTYLSLKKSQNVYLAIIHETSITHNKLELLMLNSNLYS